MIMSLNISFEPPRMPLSMAIMAAGLEQRSGDVKIVDSVNMGLSRASERAIIASYGPDLVIVNASTPTITDDMASIRDAKSLGAYTAAFGQHIDALPLETMADHPDLDFCFLQEPELVAAKFVDHWNSRDKLDNSLGLAYRSEDGQPILTPPYPRASLETFPPPARHLLDQSLYRLPDGEIYTTLLASRGCPYDCGFCVAPVYHGLKTRRRDPISLVNEVIEVAENSHIRAVMFQSDLFTSQKKWVIEVCQELIQRAPPIRWICNSRVDTVDEETLVMMKKAGCFLIGVGIESGSPRMLSVLGKKKVEPERIEWMIHTCRRLGIMTNGSFVIGYPGETIESLRQTEELVMRLPLDFAVFMCAAPFPGTRLYQYLTDPETPHRLTGNWENIAFHDYVIEGGLSPETVKQFNSRIWRKYFFSLHYAKLRLRDLKHPVRLTKTIWYALKRLQKMRKSFR